MSRLWNADDNRLSTLLWAVALVVAGLLLLLFNFGLFVDYEPTIQYGASGLLAVAGVSLFLGYLSARAHWWRLIPAWTVLAMAAMVFSTTRSELDSRWTAALLFVGLALAFGHVYLSNRSERWWAIIPGGFMVVLGGVIALSSRTEQPATLGTVLFAGMGAVFFLLYLLGERRQHWWALIPGTVLVLFGVLIFSADRSGESHWLRWWPLLLVVLGLGLAWRAYTYHPRLRLAVHTALELPSRAERQQQGKQKEAERVQGRLGQYTGPAPGSDVEVLPDGEKE